MTDTREFYRKFLLRLRNAMPQENYQAMGNLVAVAIAAGMLWPMGRYGDALARDGLVGLGRMLAPEQAQAIRDTLVGNPVHDGWQRISGTFPSHDLSQVPAEIHVAHYDDGVVGQVPDLVYLATSPGVLGPVAAFLGCAPTISYLKAWWSLAGRSEPRDAELFHVDRHDYRFVKLFVYLTDVDMHSGPHVYVRGTAIPDNLRRAMDRFGDAPNRLRFQEMHRAQRKSDEDVERFFGPQIEYLTGHAGNAFLVNTAGYHKGLLPAKGHRLMFSALYTMLPDPKIEPTKLSIPEFWDGWRQRYGAALTPEQLRYVTRLVVEG